MASAQAPSPGFTAGSHYLAPLPCEKAAAHFSEPDRPEWSCMFYMPKSMETCYASSRFCAVSMTVLSVRNSSQLHRANISDLKLSKAHTHECKFTYMGAYWQAVKKGKTNNKHITKQMNTLNGSHGTWYTCICIFIYLFVYQ